MVEADGTAAARSGVSGCGASGGGGSASGIELLGAALKLLLVEDPSLLAPTAALARSGAMLIGRERLAAATLGAVHDVDVRQLFGVAQAGSTRSWLRCQLGGDSGQLALSRRLLDRPHVAGTFAAGLIAQRAAAQLCAMLTDVPDLVEETRLVGVLDDGVRGLLATVTGRTGLADSALPAARACQMLCVSPDPPTGWVL